MSKFTVQSRKTLAEIKQAWVPLATFFVLGCSQFLVEEFYGKGWAAVAAIGAALLWSFLRPWKFGLLPDKTRRDIRFQCTLALWAFAGLAVLSFLKYGRHAA